MERSKLCLIRPFLPFISHNGILPCVFDINIVICWGFLLLYQREIFVYGCNSTDFGWSFSLLNSIYDYCGRMRDPIMIETSLAQQMYINFLKSTSTGWLCCRYWLIYNQVTQHAWTTTSTNELQRTKVNKGSVRGPWPPLGRITLFATSFLPECCAVSRIENGAFSCGPESSFHSAPHDHFIGRHTALLRNLVSLSSTPARLPSPSANSMRTEK